MKFLKYKNSDVWWEWPEGGMTVFNMAGGHHDINENSEEYMLGTVVEAEDWPDLCRKMKYNPWKVDSPTREMWIDPDGTMYDCGEWGAHEMTAQNILENLLGEEAETAYTNWGGLRSLQTILCISTTATPDCMIT